MKPYGISRTLRLMIYGTLCLILFAFKPYLYAAEPEPDYYVDFESALDGWEIADKGKQPLVIVDDKAHSGKCSAYSGPPGSMLVSKYIFPLPFVGRLEVWFFDDMAPTKHQIASVNSITNELLGIVCQGGSRYKVRIGKTYTEVPIERTQGWHEFAWECDGAKTRAFIDGKEVFVNERLHRIAYISLGSFWDDSTGWWDDLRAYIKPPISAHAFIEAEYAIRQSGVKEARLETIESRDASGSLAVLPAIPGYTLEWSLASAKSGSYNLLLKYATPESASRLKISFGDSSTELEFPATETPNTWRYLSIPVKADKGIHTLNMQTISASLHLDWIALIPTDSHPESYGHAIDEWLGKRTWMQRAFELTSQWADKEGISIPVNQDWLYSVPLPPEKDIIMYAAKNQRTLHETIDKILERQKPLLTTSFHVPAFKGIGDETPLSREYHRRLLRYLKFSYPKITDWRFAPDCRYHKRDDHLEHGVRQNAVVALAYSAMLAGAWDETLAGVSRSNVEEDLIKLLRYISITHKANFLPTGDGEPWGDHWQSAHWANFAGQAAWHVWDRLPDDVRLMTARMVVHEANRFNERPPDSGVQFDTKAEENAWNSQIIALAACMLPNHPNNMLWQERAIVWMLNSLVREADRNETSIVDGKPLKDRVQAVTIHPDFTLENHGRVHPDYLACGYLKFRNAHLYTGAGLPIPESCFYGIPETFDILYHLTAINGSFFYVNSQDWTPHRHDTCVVMYGSMNTLKQDPRAAFLERKTMDFLERMHSMFSDGTSSDPRSYVYPNPEEELMARYAELYFHHRMYGDGPEPITQEEFLKSQSGTRVFEIGGFVTHRTPTKMASFAWKNGAMGLIFSSDDTWFTAPSDRGLTGRISCEGVKDTRPEVMKHLLKADDGFSIGAQIKRCDGKIEQWTAMVSLPGDPVVYIERLVAHDSITVREIATAMVSFFNEDAPGIIPNQRTAFHDEGTSIIVGASSEPEQIQQWKTDRVNIDARFGILTTAPVMAYRDNNQYRAGRLEEEVIGNYIQNPGTIPADSEISIVALLILPNATQQETTAAALELKRVGKNIFIAQTKTSTVMANLEGERETFTFAGVQYTLDSLEICIIGQGDIQSARK